MATKKGHSKKGKSKKSSKKQAGGKAPQVSGVGVTGGGGSDQMLHELLNIKACSDRDLPPELMGEAITAAVNERADNILLPGMTPMMGMVTNSIEAPAMAVVAKKMWQPGRTLRVRFLGSPDPTVRAKIEQFAHQWESFCNIKFSFGTSAAAEIRIGTTMGLGSWSYLGTDALLIAPDKPTMNYGWFTPTTPDEEFGRTTLHEFGHALGCIHEHMHPLGGIPWNRDAVYRYYMTTQGWTKEQVDSQLFAKYDKSVLNMSAYDPKSIMHYPVPKELTTGGTFEVGWNRVLSPQDKAFIRKMYP